jgi:catechol 2,3-dioxygenase-like lactoylglutathione lyase family enzyme
MSTPAAPVPLVVIDRIDHLVLTVADLDQTIDFYVRVLGMQPITFGAGRRALRFGPHKLNLHQAGRELEPKARRPTPGSVDVCLVTTTPLARVVAHLQACQVLVEAGPVARTGATGPITSVYFRDPDGNLIEVSTYDDAEPSRPRGGNRANLN